MAKRTVRARQRSRARARGEAEAESEAEGPAEGEAEGEADGEAEPEGEADGEAEIEGRGRGRDCARGGERARAASCSGQRVGRARGAGGRPIRAGRWAELGGHRVSLCGRGGRGGAGRSREYVGSAAACFPRPLTARVELHRLALTWGLDKNGLAAAAAARSVTSAGCGCRSASWRGWGGNATQIGGGVFKSRRSDDGRTRHWPTPPPAAYTDLRGVCLDPDALPGRRLQGRIRRGSRGGSDSQRVGRSWVAPLSTARSWLQGGGLGVSTA